LKAYENAEEGATKLKELLEGAKAVIFDFDNVIVDSERYHFEAYSRVFAELGHTLDRDEYWREWTSKGGGAEGEIKRYNLPFDPAEIRRKKDPIYSSFCRDGLIKPFPEAGEIIETLHGHGFKLAVASGSYEKDIRNILQSNGLLKFFSATVGKDDIKNYKPHPETYLKAAEALNIPPGLCIAVEDAEKGIKSAHDAGMSVILIKTEITRELNIGGADLKFDNLSEFKETLKAVLES